jgi:amidase
MGLRQQSQRANENPDMFRQELVAKVHKIHSENVKFNAFLRTYFAEERTQLLFSKINEQKHGLPLFGTVFAAKDNMRVKNQPLTFGLLPPLEGQAFSHAALVELMIKKGSTLIGSTNLDPGCLDYYGDNPYYGRVINPRFQESVPGGSSSGSAAAVAAGLADFALGSDFGGSVRAPAAACGIYGLKVSVDFLPRQGIVLLNALMDGPGILTLALDDLLYLCECLGSAPAPTDAPKPQLIVPCSEELQGLEDEVAADFQYVLDQLRPQYTLHQLDFELGFEQSLEIRKAVAASDFQALAKQHRLEEQGLPPALRAILAYERILTPSQKETAEDQQRAISAKLAAMLDSSSFIVTPTLPAKPPSWSSLRSGRTALPSRRLNRFLALANCCALPALSMPLEDTLSKFPFSIQIIGSAGNDYQLLKTANLIQEAVWRSRQAPFSMPK